MPSYDFEVDLQALATAAQGMADTVQLLKDKDVEDLVPTEGMLGSAVVWDAVAEFKDRWELGLNNLVGDVEEMAGRLGQVATNYAQFDVDGRDRATGLAADLRGLDLRA